MRAFFLVCFSVAAFAQVPQVITLHSASPLVELRVMVKAGSAEDAPGLEGLAHLTAEMLLQGSFGDPAAPVTKEKLAEITRPWGEQAMPQARVEKETTTFFMTVPPEKFSEFRQKVLEPMFLRPLFEARELERLRKEQIEFVSSQLRFENAERLGWVALDNFIHEGTSYAHPVEGTAAGLKKIQRADILRFYRAHYRAANLAVGLGSDDAALSGAARAALAKLGAAGAAAGATLSRPPRPVRQRELLIIAQPGAISTGIHAGFPLDLTRAAEDFWPLYVANIYLGTHRDPFGRLFQDIREERGYNYGDYSYLEHMESPWEHLFPPLNTPRRFQDFALWVRPVAHKYAHHLLKAITWELENLVRRGLSSEQVEEAKKKARILYLNLAENTSRLLGYRLDDWFYGMTDRGYLEKYLERVERVTPEQANAAIRKHLQAGQLKYVVVTDEATARQLAADVPADRNAGGKTPQDYGLEATEREGVKTWQVPASRLQTLQLDKVWEEYRLRIPAERIHVVPAQALFQR